MELKSRNTENTMKICMVSGDALPISNLLERIKKPPVEEIAALRELGPLLETTNTRSLL
jgi:hypothetical protein